MTFKHIFLLLIFIFVSSVHAEMVLTPDEQNYLKEKKEIKLCVSPKGLPLFGYKEGNNIGILPEVLSLVEKKTPIPFRYVAVKTWKECIELSQRKKVDIAALILNSPNNHLHSVC